ncbi:response regulator [Muricauda sp. NFXS6]|mgnify:CR=1 FL=1|uniref:response regulator n=1 Tax=Allomuricauda sp. NFXS6 TaxID=2819094 RepID=UPI0032E00C16|tara:strand:- start:8670 stop:9749 length:1080 start_codon:yes stop_codon:yes gene_type:complete
MKKVLVIEDNREVRENTVEILELANYNVIAAANGRAGIQMAMEQLPDIIISDIVMPEANGYTVLEVLSQNSDTANIPFIFLSAKDKKEDIRMGMSLGADDYIYKPYRSQELLDAVEMRIKKHNFIQQKFSKTPVGINHFFKEVSEYLGKELISKERESQIFKDRERIYQEGNAAHYLYFIEDGNIKTFRGTESGKEMITGLYGPGDFVGQLSLLGSGGTYLETAIVMEHAKVLGIPKEDFIHLVYQDKEVANKFLGIISNNMIDLQGKLIDIAYSSVDRRAAKALLELHEKGILKDEHHKGVDMLREDFASLIGVAKETAIRTLTKFREIGLVGTDKKRKLTILDIDRLKRIADFEGML